MLDFRKGFFAASKKRAQKSSISMRRTTKESNSCCYNTNLREKAEEIDKVHPKLESLGIQSFRINEHGAVHQNSTNLQEDLKKLIRENSKLTELLYSGFQDTLDLRMASRRGKSIPYETTTTTGKILGILQRWEIQGSKEQRPFSTQSIQQKKTSVLKNTWRIEEKQHKRSKHDQWEKQQ